MTENPTCNQIVKTYGISGFPRSYEEGCQKMLWTGIKYLAKYDQPSDLLKGTARFENVFGLIDTPEAFAECKKLMLEVNEGCSGAQYHGVINHLQYIAKHGLSKWRSELEKSRPEGSFDFDLESMKIVGVYPNDK